MPLPNVGTVSQLLEAAREVLGKDFVIIVAGDKDDIILPKEEIPFYVTAIGIPSDIAERVLRAVGTGEYRAATFVQWKGRQ